MSRGQGGEARRDNVYMRQSSRNALGLHFAFGGSATCSDGDGDAAARNREVENELRVSAPIGSRWITAIVNFAKRVRACENVYRVSSVLSRISARLD